MTSLGYSLVNKSHMRERNKKDLISILVSICCFYQLIYFGTALWDIITRDEGLNDLEWLVYLVRGVIWISVSVSLVVRTSKSIKIVISVWWKSFSLLVSAINIRLLFQTHNLPFFDLIQWPVNIMLLVFGFRYLISSSDTKCSEDHQVLYEPLFACKAKKAQVSIGRASFLSKLTFSWINPLFSLGHSELLTLEDIPSLVERFAQALESLVRGNSLSNSKNLVLRALAKVYFKENVLIGICAFLRIVSVVYLPLLLYVFVDYSNHNEENRYEGLTILGCLVICKVVESLSQRHQFFSSRRSGMRMRSALMAAVYRKQLNLSCIGRRRHSTGEIVNYIAVDAYRLGEFPWWLHSAWSLVLSCNTKKHGGTGHNDIGSSFGYDSSDKSVVIQAGNFSWDTELTVATLRDVNLEIKKGQKIAICRLVGTGKSSILHVMFGEIPKISGTDCVMAALRNKTVILVTHQVEFLSEIDTILVMDGGSITQIRSYTELLMSGTVFEELVNAHKDAMIVVDLLSNENKGKQQDTDTLQAEEYNKCYSTQQKSEGEIFALGLPGVQLTKEEEKGTGDFGWRTFLDYIVVSKGYLFLSLAILSQFSFAIFQAAATYWLAIAIQIPKISSGLLIGVYTGISTLSAVFVHLRSIYSAHSGLKASKAFFYGFINSIFKAPMLFFDSTPVGRILTRASSDLSILDFDLPLSIRFVAAGSIELVAAIGVIAFVTWEVLIVAILVMIAVTYIQGYYLASARELIRINGTTKAPVMNYAAETSLGVVTIKAFNVVDRFFKNYLKLVDTDATLFFLCNAATEWLILRIEALQNMTIFASVFILILLPKGYVPPGLVGLSLSYAFSITSTQVFWSRWHCNLSNYMISIRYRPNVPLVLKGITYTFKEGTRVGVVGRSGSGKSTLVGALFRLVESVEGKIFIDGLDICSIGLKDLRMKLSIIPQEPTLFRGSVRTNLDPLDLYTDREIRKALEKCQLKATISSLPNKLDSSDEATASIDSATDAFLQQIIRQEFSECTVIIVAHKVPTIIDSDMVLVLSYGKLIEYDEPARLMGMESGFSKLIAEYWSSCRKGSS
ncbi:hypothetical protein J1N35_038923 [Gossypium stocksii]|uniref:ABC-type xenobiotic transporter n=1 Tax=Gossypium stocksii TaxID=47602 RepID=A0A9D3ZN19_9ROSI|nr:hypothetical protein J1N35_038923 [Gossypium stocksii]